MLQKCNIYIRKELNSYPVITVWINIAFSGECEIQVMPLILYTFIENTHKIKKFKDIELCRYRAYTI